MHIDGEAYPKLDFDLLTILTQDRYAPQVDLPVIITAEPEGLAHVIELAKAHGARIRHTLESIDAVSAWLTVKAVRDLAQEDRIKGMELTQHDTIAAP